MQKTYEEENKRGNKEKVRNTKQKNLGITLIALVITIIILLILAGVTLSLTLGENGLLKRAEDGVAKYENAKNDENKRLEELTSSMMIATNDNSQITINMKDLQSIIDARVEKKIADRNVGINEGTILMESNNKSLKVENVNTKSFTNVFKENFTKYFEYNAETGEITCLEDGNYMIWLNVSLLSDGDWVATYGRCVINDIIIGGVSAIVDVNSRSGDDENNINIYLKKGDKINFTKNTHNVDAKHRNNLSIKLMKM